MSTPAGHDIIVELDAQELARIDALARTLGVSRDAMILRLVLVGLAEQEAVAGRGGADGGTS